ncbi:MAG: hypothetical protein LUD69_05790 [Oscillospiraceae bacterium]|nr:hypothetical protein [Oscillospiraceae bacterium]
MSFEVFRDQILRFAKRTGIHGSPRFEKRDGGRFAASYPGVYFWGCDGSKKVTVQWGYRRHLAVADLEEVLARC